eukprot:7892052-Pyramimonas_sp.AAC.1
MRKANRFPSCTSKLQTASEGKSLGRSVVPGQEGVFPRKDSASSSEGSGGSAFICDGPIRRSKRGCILMTDQSNTGGGVTEERLRELLRGVRGERVHLLVHHM